MVVLLGQTAYKVKKPVSYPFLDFSTAVDSAAAAARGTPSVWDDAARDVWAHAAEVRRR